MPSNLYLFDHEYVDTLTIVYIKIINNNSL